MLLQIENEMYEKYLKESKFPNLGTIHNNVGFVSGCPGWPRWRGCGSTGIAGRQSTAARQKEPRGEPVRPGVPAPPHQGATGAQAQERGSLAGRES